MIVEIEDSVAELVAIRAEETNKAKICLVRLRGLCGRPLPESYRSERIGPTIEADLQPRQIDRGSRSETDQGPSVAPAIFGSGQSQSSRPWSIGVKSSAGLVTLCWR